MPKLSIVTPCYNAAKFIESNIRSVNNQTFQDWERIFINDGSKDDTARIIEKAILNDDRQKIVHIENHGVSFARNHGFSLISPDSDYIIFLDADDLYHPDFLSEMVTVLEKDRQAGAVFCYSTFIDEEDRVIGGMDWPRFLPSFWWVKEIPDNHLYTPFISIYAWTRIGEGFTLLRREVFERAGGWNTDLRYGEGIYLFSQVSLFSRILYLDKKLFFYRRHSGQATANLSNHQEQAERIEGKIQEMAKKEFPESRQMMKEAFLFVKYRLTAYRQLQMVSRLYKDKEFLSALKLIRYVVLNYAKSLQTGYRHLRKK